MIKEKDTYTYQGVYLLSESIKQGPNRINVSKYKASKSYNSYMVRRDRYDQEYNMHNTYATENGLSTGYLGLRYPSKYRVTKEIERHIGQAKEREWSRWNDARKQTGLVEET